MISSDTDSPLLNIRSCTCCKDCKMWSYLYYFLLQLSARELSFWWGIPQYIEWTKYPWGKYSLVHHFSSCVAQYLSNLGVLWLPSWMEMWKVHHQTPHVIEVRHDQFMGLEPEILILHEILINRDKSLHVIRVPTWLVQLYFLAIFHLRHKLYIPMCSYY